MAPLEASAGSFSQRKDQFVSVTVEQLAPCRVLLKVEVEAAKVDGAFEKVTAGFQKEARLPGFRPGKAPPYMVIRSFGAEIEQEVRRQLFGEHYRQALKEKELRVLGQPDFEEVQFGRGKDFVFTATLETEPAFALPEYKGIPVEVEVREVTDADLERALMVLREQRAEHVDVERPAGTGDFVVVNYRGTCEGKPITEHSPTAKGLTEQKEFWLRIEEGHFIPGFTEQLVGASAGEHRTVTVTFPEDFVVPVLVGKQGVYEVEVVKVKERRLPELDDAFAGQFGAGTAEDLRTGVRRDLENEIKYKRISGIRNQIVQTLLQRVECELPESIVDHETRNVMRDIIQENRNRGFTKEAIQEHTDEIASAAKMGAKDRVKSALILHRIAETEKIQVAEQELLQRIALIAQRRGQPAQKVLKELQEAGQINNVAEDLLIAKVLDFLQLQAVVTEVPARPAA